MFNYQYQQNNPQHQNSWGVINNEARFVPGAFTDPDNNSSGGQYGIHRAWIAYQIEDGAKITVGKSQVPFAGKTSNFWPGDMFLAGYGDQMDVGVKASQTLESGLHYDAALYLADDRSTSTDTMDDNGHWGSTATYRKVQTAVGNLSYALTDAHTLGVSAQAGGLQGLVSGEEDISGDHQAAALYYLGQFGALSAKASVIATERNLPDEVADLTLGNTRYAGELGCTYGKCFFFANLTYATPVTHHSPAEQTAGV